MGVSTVAKYRPKIATLLSLCESNYVLLSRLIAGKTNVGEQRTFSIAGNLGYKLEILETTRYTNFIEIQQISQFIRTDKSENNTLSKTINNALIPKMKIRLYHDARLAEVIATQGMRQIKPRYDYPNDKMHQPDEKQQMSMFLKEWLQICLRLGLADPNGHQAQK